jgi:hypothetical protein
MEEEMLPIRSRMHFSHDPLRLSNLENTIA